MYVTQLCCARWVRRIYCLLSSRSAAAARGFGRGHEKNRISSSGWRTGSISVSSLSLIPEVQSRLQSDGEKLEQATARRGGTLSELLIRRQQLLLKRRERTERLAGACCLLAGAAPSSAIVDNTTHDDAPSIIRQKERKKAERDTTAKNRNSVSFPFDRDGRDLASIE